MPIDKEIAKENALEVINSWSKSRTISALLPGTTYTVATHEIKLVQSIASIYKIELSREELGKLMSLIAVQMETSKIVGSVLDFIPIVGWFAKSSISMGATKGVGEFLISYFEDKLLDENYAT